LNKLECHIVHGKNITVGLAKNFSEKNITSLSRVLPVFAHKTDHREPHGHVLPKLVMLNAQAQLSTFNGHGYDAQG
jgi:hypothetical protein